MTDSHADASSRRRRAALAALAVGVLLAGETALAQDAGSGPRRLSPDGSPPTVGEGAAPPTEANNEPPKRLTPRRLVPDRRDPEPQRSPSPAASDSGFNTAPVASDELRQVDPDSIGLLGSGDGGLGSDLWRGLDRVEAQSLLRKLPPTFGNAALRDLARRLMLSAAPARGNTANQPSGNAETDSPMLALRIESLMSMGATADAERLLEVIPQSRDSARLTGAQLDLLMLDNDLDGACALARREIDRFPTPAIRRVSILCQARDGSAAAASFGLSLLRDEGIEDRYFAAVVRRIGETGSAPVGVADVPPPERVTPLHLAAMREAGTAPPDDIVARATPAVLASLAGSGPGQPGTRLEAGMAATRAGAMSPIALSTVLDRQGFSEAELDNPISRAQELPAPQALALLYRSAKRESLRAARAESILTALDIAASVGAYPTAARLFAPLEAEIAPAPELSWFAPAAARLNLLVNDRSKAADWAALANPTTGDDAATRADRLSLDLLLALAEPSDSADLAAALPASLRRPRPDDRADLLRRWINAQQEAYGNAAGDRVALMLSLLDALGRIDSAVLWRAADLSAQRGKATAPDPVVWYRLPLAVDAGNPGETVLLSLILAGGETPGPIQMRRALASLDAAGFSEEATAAAIEAALDAGL